MSEPVRREIHVRCSVDAAFAAFADRIDLWWPTSHRRHDDSTLILEPMPGGRFLERTRAGEEIVHGRVVRWEPPGHLVYTWLPGAVREPTTVEVRFTPDGAGTRVRVVHSEGDSALGEQWTRRARKFAAAWEHLLPLLAAHVAGGEGEPS